MDGQWPSQDIDAARRHFDWICAHPDGRLSDRLKRLLGYLLDRSFLGREAAPSQADIARNVLGRSGDFDPSVDAHVRVEVARLRNALELFYSRVGRALALRFDLPKGRYCVVLQRAAEPALVAGQFSENNCTIAIAEPVAFPVSGAEMAHLVLSEALLRCSHSPIVRCGALSVTPLPGHSQYADSIDAAVACGASAVVTCKIFADEGDLRFFLTIFETASRKLVRTESCTLDTAQFGRCGLARQMGKLLATIVSDPFTGIGPRIVAKHSRDLRLNAILSAYQFIDSQELATASKAFEALEHLIGGSEQLCATSMALFADMHRVCHNAGLQPEASRKRSIEFAEQAYRADQGNGTAMLAFGYAALSTGASSLAASIASQIPADESSHSINADHALLAALTEDCSQETEFSDPLLQENRPIMGQMAILVPAVRRGDEASVLDLLGGKRHRDTMWHDIFRCVAAAHVGERSLARASATRLIGKIPEINVRLAPMLAGFFPDCGELGYLIDGLGKAGIQVNSASA